MQNAVEFIKAITEKQIDFICQADRGEDVEIHKATLRKLIFEQDRVLKQDQSRGGSRGLGLLKIFTLTNG